MTTVRIPDNWNGDEALAVVAFLERVIAAIWKTHAPQMSRELERAEDRQSALSAGRQGDMFDEDSITF
jgi:hypothetical protein